MKFLPLIFTLLIPVTVMAQENADYTKVQLLSATTGTGNLPSLDMGLELAIKDQWYTYWRMPGDSGVAPVLKWDGSENVKDVIFHWPVPKRFTTMGMHSFGYDGTTLFPLTVIPKEPGKDVGLKLAMDLMVCHDICIPQTITAYRVFSAGLPNKSEQAAEIEAALKKLPAIEGNKDLSIETVVLGKEAVVVTAKSATPLDEKTDLIVETENGMLTAPPEIISPTNSGDGYVLKVKGPEGRDLTGDLFGKSVKILLINGDQAVEKEVNF